MDDSTLLHAVERALGREGGLVVVRENAGNLVRRALPQDDSTFEWIIEVEGLPNLLHEFVHVALLGRLEVDHGYDYNLIPFDTARPEQRAWLWEELACCVVSCAYLARDEARVVPWFREQVGIQHHFFGFGGNAAFLAHVDRLRLEHVDESVRTEERAYTNTERWLVAANPGLDPRPARRLSLSGLWAQLD